MGAFGVGTLGMLPACFATGRPQRPKRTLSLFGMPSKLHLAGVQRFVEQTRSSCMFMLASGEESALA